MYKSKGGFQDKLHQKKTTERGLEKDQGYLFESPRSSNSTITRVPQKNPCDIYLQGLKAYISERNGALEDGWHVEFQYSSRKSQLEPVFCAPDGKKFESVFEVAAHLGLMSNYQTEEAKLPIGVCLSMQECNHAPKRRKLSRFSNGHGASEQQENWSSILGDKISSDVQAMEMFNGHSGNNQGHREALPEGHDGGSLQTNVSNHLL